LPPRTTSSCCLVHCLLPCTIVTSLLHALIGLLPCMFITSLLCMLPRYLVAFFVSLPRCFVTLLRTLVTLLFCTLITSLLRMLPHCLATSSPLLHCLTTSSPASFPHLATSSCYFFVSLRCLVASLCSFVASCATSLLCYLTSLPSHATLLPQVPSNPLICCFIASRLVALLPHYLVGWYFPPPSFARRSLELEEASFPTTIRKVSFFCLFIYSCHMFIYNVI
jgi:hypothetical protein